MIRIAVPGVKGRMGAAIASQALQATDLQLALVTAKADDPNVGTKFAATQLIIASELQASSFDVLIDFTTPVAVMQHLDYCLHHNIAMVIGVTGFGASQLQIITQAASRIPILMSANMSIGVNICYKLLTQACKMFDNSWKVAISDIHHQHKKDSPSGTAKQLAQIIAAARGVDIATIPIHSERLGDVVGEHSVTFSNATETITINHTANTRDIFALGAVNAARWIYGREPKLYNMLDVIG